MWGITATGFVAKTVDDVMADYEALFRQNVDPNIVWQPGEPLYETALAVAQEVATHWANAKTLYEANDPNTASAVLLDNICSITGTKRRGATFSRVVVTCNCGANATIPAGTQLNVSGQPSNLWQLIGVGTSTTNYTPGDLTTTTAGAYSAVFQATNTGAQIATAGTLTVITAGTVSGLNSVTNPADAIVGTDFEQDAPLRIRRDQELAQSGASTTSAIRAALLEVPGVVQAFVYENTGDTIDAFGRPPHSIEAVIFDGVSPAASNDAIAKVLWANKPAGIRYYSATGDSGNATDSQGNTQVMKFSRAQVVNIYLAYTVKTGTSFDAINGPTAIKQAVADYARDYLGLGSSVNALELMAVPLGPLSPFAITGVTDVTALALDTHSSPTATANLAMSVRQYPYVQTGNIAVTVT